MHYGEWPKEFIDHIDGDRSNNKISNLRVASRSENAKNHPKRKDSSSGIKGVSWHIVLNKWQARVQDNKIRYHLGYFDDISLAIDAVNKFRLIKHKEFTNNG